MEQNIKHIAEMQNAADIGAALIELGGERPAYARDLVTLCKGAVEQGMPLDAAIAALAKMADAVQWQNDQYNAASAVYADICEKVAELFRKVMLKEFEVRDTFNLQYHIENETLLMPSAVEKFGLECRRCFQALDDEFVVICELVGTESNPNPFFDMFSKFEARFTSSADYSGGERWTEEKFNTCFTGATVEKLRIIQNISLLSDISEWLNNYLIFIKLSEE
jgi:hypothetical protein